MYKSYLEHVVNFMIPQFPIFKKISTEDRKDVESFTHKYEPYSDFNFTSLWSWDTNDERMISQLNDNLVVIFTDYESNEQSLSFLGNNKPKETAHELINYTKILKISPILNFIPEESINGINDVNLKIEEDKDNFDYIYSIYELFLLKGIKYKEKRHSSDRFFRDHPEAIFEVNKFNELKVSKLIRSVFENWKNKKILDNKIYNSDCEEKTISRLLDTAKYHELIVSSIFLGNQMIGFSIDEVLPNNYVMSHFFKADNSYKGIYDFLNKKVAEYLISRGATLWNWEQDLGLTNLRKSKLSYRPINFLRKYKISLINK